MLKYLWLAALALGLVLGGLAPAQAVELGISPPDINLQLERGQTYQGEIYLYGSETENVSVKVSLMDWSLTGKGEYLFLPARVLERSVAPWLTVAVNFSLPPQKGQKIRYTLKVPPDANGSYWGAIMFATSPVLQKGSSPRIAVSGRLAYIIRLDIKGSPMGSGNIEKYQLSWNEATQRVEASIRVKNDGLSFVRMKSKLQLRDSQGRLVGEAPFNEGYVLPGFSREFSLAENQLKLPPGYYIGLAIIDFGESKLKAVQNSLVIKK